MFSHLKCVLSLATPSYKKHHQISLHFLKKRSLAEVSFVVGLLASSCFYERLRRRGEVRVRETFESMADQRLDLGADTVPDNAADLTLFVQNLLEQMQGRFNTMSTSIISRIDEMGNRIDDLEKSIGELMQQVRNHYLRHHRRTKKGAISVDDIPHHCVLLSFISLQAGVDANAADGGDEAGKK